MELQPSSPPSEVPCALVGKGFVVPRLPLRDINVNIPEGPIFNDDRHLGGGPCKEALQDQGHSALLPQVTLQELAGWPSGLHGLHPSSCASSRDSSPCRSSSLREAASVGLPADSGHTTAGGPKRSYAAGPRSYIRSQAKRPGLDTGDVVVFLEQAVPYTVVRFQEAAPGGSSIHALQLGNSSDLPSERSCQLEVIRQGSYIGFRSATADDRFLQVRRRGKHRLVFYNSNFGVWEQWELIGGQPVTAWDRVRLCLRNRQLQQFTVTVDVMRIGSYAVLPHMNLTPRSLVPLEHPLADSFNLESAELHKMGEAMISTWSQFVDKEKQARRTVDGKVNDLLAELELLKSWAEEQVHGLRTDLSSALCELSDTVVDRDQQLADAEERMSLKVRWGLALIQRRLRAGLCRCVLHWWRRVAERQRQVQHAMAVQQQRYADKRLRTVVSTWCIYTRYRNTLADRFHEVVTRMIARRMTGAFKAWRAAVEEQKLDKLSHQMQNEEAAQKAVLRLQQRSFRSIFGEWRNHTMAMRQARLGAASLSAMCQQRRTETCLAWWHSWCTMQQHHRYVLTVGLNNYVDRLTRSAFSALQRNAAQARKFKASSDARLMELKARTAASVIRHWSWIVQQRVALRATLSQANDRKQRHTRSMVLHEWHIQAVLRRKRAVAGQRVQVRQTRMVKANAFAAWLVSTRCSLEVQHKVRFFQHKHLARLAMSTFGGWRADVTDRQAQVAAMRDRIALRQLSACFSAFSEAVAIQKVAEAQASRMAAQADRELLAMFLQEWQAIVSARRALKASLHEFVMKAAITRLAAALCGWRDHVQRAKEVARLADSAYSRKMQTCIRDVFDGWRDYTLERQRLQDALRSGIQLRAQCLMAEAFNSWLEYTAEAQEWKQRLLHFVDRTAVTRMRQALRAWRECTHEQIVLQARLRKAVRVSSRLKLQQAWAAWQLACEATQAKKLMQRRASKLAVMHMLRRAWSAWNAYVMLRQQKAASLSVQSRKNNTRLLARAYNSWRNARDASQIARATADDRAWLLSQKTAREVLHAWHAAALRSKRNKVVSSNAAAGANRRRMQDVFAAWHETSSTTKAWHCSLQDMADARYRELVSEVLLGWQAAAREKRASRRAGCACIARMLSVTLADGFAAWREHAFLARSVRVFTQQVQAKRDKETLVLTMLGWRDTVASSKAAANKLELVASAQLLRSTCPLPAVAMTSDLATWHYAQKLAAFASWLDYVQTRRWHRIILSRAVSKLAKRVLRASFQEWREEAACSRRRDQVLLALSAKSLLVQKREAFGRWRSNAAKQVAAREELQSCIVRRRISFDAFKVQYWEVMEKDLQGTLQTFNDTAGATINTPGPAPNPYRSRAFWPMESASLVLPPLDARLAAAGRHRPPAITEDEVPHDVGLSSGIFSEGLVCATAAGPVKEVLAQQPTPGSSGSVTSHPLHNHRVPAAQNLTPCLQLLQTYGETPMVLTRPHTLTGEGFDETPSLLPRTLDAVPTGPPSPVQIPEEAYNYCPIPPPVFASVDGESNSMALCSEPGAASSANLAVADGQNTHQMDTSPHVMCVGDSPESGVIDKGSPVHLTAAASLTSTPLPLASQEDEALDAVKVPSPAPLPAVIPFGFPSPAVADREGVAPILRLVTCPTTSPADVSLSLPSPAAPDKQKDAAILGGINSPALTPLDIPCSSPATAGGEELAFGADAAAIVHVEAPIAPLSTPEFGAERDVGQNSVGAGAEPLVGNRLDGQEGAIHAIPRADVVGSQGTPAPTPADILAEDPEGAITFADEIDMQVLEDPKAVPAQLSATATPPAGGQGVAGAQVTLEVTPGGILACPTPWRAYTTPAHVTSPDETAFNSALSISFAAVGHTPLTTGPPSVTGPYLPRGTGGLSFSVEALRYHTEQVLCDTPVASDVACQGSPSALSASFLEEDYLREGAGNVEQEREDVHGGADDSDDGVGEADEGPDDMSGLSDTPKYAAAEEYSDGQKAYRITERDDASEVADGVSQGEPTLVQEGVVCDLAWHEREDTLGGDSFAQQVPTVEELDHVHDAGQAGRPPVEQHTPLVDEVACEGTEEVGGSNLRDGARNVVEALLGNQASTMESIESTPHELHVTRPRIAGMVFSGDQLPFVVPAGEASDTEDAFYYTQPAALGGPLYRAGSDIVIAPPFRSWHGPLGTPENGAVGVAPVMVDNPLSQSPGVFPVHQGFKPTAEGNNPTGEYIPSALASFEDKLAAVASPQEDAVSGGERPLDDVLQAHGSHERPAFRAVVGELQDHFIRNSPTAAEQGVDLLSAMEAAVTPGMSIGSTSTAGSGREWIEHLVLSHVAQSSPPHPWNLRSDPASEDEQGVGASISFFNPAFTSADDV